MHNLEGESDEERLPRDPGPSESDEESPASDTNLDSSLGEGKQIIIMGIAAARLHKVYILS